MNPEQPVDKPKASNSNTLLIIVLVIAVVLAGWWFMTRSQVPMEPAQDEVSVDLEVPVPDATDTPEMEVVEE